VRFKAYSRVKYAFPILVAAIAVTVFAAPANKKIWPNAVDFSGGKITGSFVITTTGGPDSLLSNGAGGACLLVDLNRFNIPDTSGLADGKCTENSECQLNLPRGGLLESEWHGYCDPDEQVCWVRPGGPNDPDLCNKQPFTPWSETTKHSSNTEPFNLSKPRYEVSEAGLPGENLLSFSQVYPGPVRWRVAACLNGVFTPQPGVLPPCVDPTSMNRRQVLGPPVWVPFPPYASPANTGGP
jgi:hypothetical protein